MLRKDPRQISGQRNISYARYPKKRFIQINRNLYGDAMLVPIRMSTYLADGNQRNICYRVLLQKREFILQGTHKH